MSDLLEKLQQLYRSSEYPLHMPGHKRNPYIDGLEGAYQIDITEIEGYDNLYEADGIILEALEYAKKFYGSDDTIYLVNGSTVGILSAITAVAGSGGKLLVARNCHKAVYHAIELCHCSISYLHPVWDQEWDIVKEITVQEIKMQLEKNPDVKAVILTSPTYEGQVSDILEIAEVLHKRNIPLIVDEAHGAHFIYDRRFPKSAIELGADIVIQSMHKTLPCFTQTALLHMKKGYVDIEKVKEYVSYYQTSSPSYLFMATMDHCIRELSRKTESPWENMFYERKELLKEANSFHYIRIKEDTEPCKILVSVKNTNITGKELQKILLEKYKIQIEMACRSYVIAIITAWDTKMGFQRLIKALTEIDSEICGIKTEDYFGELPEESIVYSVFEARQMEKELVSLEEAESRIAYQFVNLYPPGTPLVVPGEKLTTELLEAIKFYYKKDYNVQGLTKKGEVAVCK